MGKVSVFVSGTGFCDFLGRANAIRKQAVASLGLRTGDSVLEVACGSGRNLRYLVDAVGSNGTIVGTDYSKEMLQAAQALCDRKGWRNVQLVHGDAAQLDIGAERFDGVLSVLGISAIPDWDQALERCRAALKVNGALVVCDGRLFRGAWSFLNPLVKRVYSRFAAWDSSKDIPSKMQELFGNVDVQHFNAGTFFIARSHK